MNTKFKNERSIQTFSVICQVHYIFQKLPESASKDTTILGRDHENLITMAQLPITTI